MNNASLREFRGDDTCNSLSFWKDAESWACCDSLNVQVYANNEWTLHDLSDAGIIPTAFDISPNGSECVIGYDKKVHIHEFPNVSKVIVSPCNDSKLMVTKVCYCKSGKFM